MIEKIKVDRQEIKRCYQDKNNPAQINIELKSDDEEPVDLNRVMLEILISVHESMKTKKEAS